MELEVEEGLGAKKVCTRPGPDHDGCGVAIGSLVWFGREGVEYVY